MRELAKLESPDDTKPITAITTRRSGNSETNDASAIEDANGPPPMAPKRSLTVITASSHRHRSRHLAMSNTGARYPPE